MRTTTVLCDMCGGQTTSGGPSFTFSAVNVAGPVGSPILQPVFLDFCPSCLPKFQAVLKDPTVLGGAAPTVPATPGAPAVPTS